MFKNLNFEFWRRKKIYLPIVGDCERIFDSLNNGFLLSSSIISGDLDRSRLLWNKLDLFGDLDRSLDLFPNKPDEFDPVFLGDLDRSLWKRLFDDDDGGDLDRAGDLDLSLLLKSISRSLKLDRTGAATGDLDRSLKLDLIGATGELDSFGELLDRLSIPK